MVVDRPPGAGPAAARNEGARRARSDVLVFVDADVLPHRDAFGRIRSAFAADPGLSAIFGSYDDDPAAPGLVSAFRNLLHHHVHQSSPGPASTFWAGLGAIRRETFVAVGGFDAERYTRPSVEDIELGTRLVAAGERILLDPELRGTHLKHWTLRSMVQVDFARRGVPWVALLLRRRSGSTALNLGWRHQASAVASVAAVGGVVLRRPLLAALATAGLVALNRSFYGLVLRRRGPSAAVAGVALHALHHLTGVAAVPAGIVAHLLERRNAGQGRPTDH